MSAPVTQNQIAKLQSAITVMALVFWWSVAYWLWPRQPLLAVLCLAGPWLMTALIVALQFVMLALVDRSTPRPSALQWLRAWAFEVWVCWKVFHWLQPFRSQSRPDSLVAGGGRGVLFIHGFFCNRGLWTHWMDALKAQDRAYVALSLEPAFGSIDRYASAVDHAVQQLTQATGQAPLIVCHSMGGLAARAWLAQSNANGERVHRIVTLGTPHRGTWIARFSHAQNGRQMRENSSWLQSLTGRELSEAHRQFVCFFSNCDNIVFPVHHASLPSADNRRVLGLGHLALAFSPAVQGQVLEYLQ